MKRRILLLMMTALLSVGAWAQSLWTKTLFEGTQEISSSSKLTIAKSELQGARVGSKLTIYLSAFSNGDMLIYCDYPWKAEWANANQKSVSVILDSDFINGSGDISIYPQSDGHTGTVTKVTLNYNGVDYLYNAESFSPYKYNNWNGALQLDLTNASV